VAGLVVVEVGRAAAVVVGGVVGVGVVVTVTVDVTVEVTVEVRSGVWVSVSVSVAVGLSEDVSVAAPVRVGRVTVALGVVASVVGGREMVSPVEGRSVATGRLPPPPHPLSVTTSPSARQVTQERTFDMVIPPRSTPSGAGILPRNRPALIIRNG
jgi:hypothetical protein